MPEKIEKNDHGKTLMNWDFFEYQEHQRTVGWYIGGAIIFLGLLVYAVFSANYLFAFIIVMITIVIAIHSFKKPAKIKFAIVEDGIEVETKFYPWSDLRNFWIVYQPPEVKTLYFSFKGLKPSLPIYLENQNPVKVREILLKYLKEDTSRESEPAGDELARWLKI